MAAVTLRRIFKMMSTLSEYLQTSGLNILQTWMVDATTKDLGLFERDFQTIFEKASNLVRLLTEKALISTIIDLVFNEYCISAII